MLVVDFFVVDRRSHSVDLGLSSCCRQSVGKSRGGSAGTFSIRQLIRHWNQLHSLESSDGSSGISLAGGESVSLSSSSVDETSAVLKDGKESG